MQWDEVCMQSAWLLMVMTGDFISRVGCGMNLSVAITRPAVELQASSRMMEKPPETGSSFIEVMQVRDGRLYRL